MNYYDKQFSENTISVVYHTYVPIHKPYARYICTFYYYNTNRFRLNSFYNMCVVGLISQRLQNEPKENRPLS